MNCRPAAEWPDWRGATAVIVATGPSAKEARLEEIRGLSRVIAIKTSWRLCPWADVLYGCDRIWWIEQRGEPTFQGLKISASPTVCKVFRDIRLVTLVAKTKVVTGGETGRIGCGLRTGGGHSGFHALNLAVQFGATRLVLVGFDMGIHRGAHWHEPILGAHRLSDKQMAEHREALDGCADQFRALGVEVLNASPHSALRAYPKVDLIEAIHGDQHQARSNQSRHRVAAE